MPLYFWRKDLMRFIGIWSEQIYFIGSTRVICIFWWYFIDSPGRQFIGVLLQHLQANLNVWWRSEGVHFQGASWLLSKAPFWYDLKGKFSGWRTGTGCSCWQLVKNTETWVEAGAEIAEIKHGNSLPYRLKFSKHTIYFWGARLQFQLLFFRIKIQPKYSFEYRPLKQDSCIHLPLTNSLPHTTISAYQCIHQPSST